MSGEAMRILAQDGIRDVEVTDPGECSALGSYWNDVRFYLEGQAYNLDRYQGVVVGGYALETDPAWIEHWADSGELEFEEIYAVR